MKPFRIAALLALLLTAAFSGVTFAAPMVFAAPMAPPPGEQGAGPAGDDGPDAGPGPGERRGPGGHHPGRLSGHPMGAPGLPFLRGIDLTEAQQDRLFAILHAEAPQLREQDKIEDRAHAALRAMRAAGDYSEAKAAPHARALGQAIAERELLRVRTAGQVLALLTAEQRARIERDARRQPEGRP